MKMGSGLFFGLFLILLGFALIIKYVFDLDIPVVRILIALLLVFIGIRMLLGKSVFQRIHVNKNDVIFSESRFEGKDMNKNEYNVIFGKSVFDLRDLDSIKLHRTIEFNTIFGATLVKINQELPVKIIAEGVFGSARLPGRTTAVFGKTEYTTKTFDPEKEYLLIKADVVFGDFELRTY
ncbi:MAG: hypothetical protein KAX05_08960 [Bacteroidales bacterium]|nr:hypothetical protein [Bacteroidales bacterium]